MDEDVVHFSTLDTDEPVVVQRQPLSRQGSQYGLTRESSFRIAGLEAGSRSNASLSCCESIFCPVDEGDAAASYCSHVAEDADEDSVAICERRYETARLKLIFVASCIVPGLIFFTFWVIRADPSCNPKVRRILRSSAILFTAEIVAIWALCIVSCVLVWRFVLV